MPLSFSFGASSVFYHFTTGKLVCQSVNRYFYITRP